MARSDRAAFLGTLRAAERQMSALFEQMARELGEVVLQAAGEDGTIAVERIPEVQRAAHRIVDRYFLGNGGVAFGEQNEPLSPYARIVADGQWAMIDAELSRQAKLLDRLMPADVREGVRRQYLARQHG